MLVSEAEFTLTSVSRDSLKSAAIAGRLGAGGYDGTHMIYTALAMHISKPLQLESDQQSASSTSGPSEEFVLSEAGILGKRRSLAND